METQKLIALVPPGTADLPWYYRNERRCFRSAEANCVDKDPAENGFHCCMLPLGHEGPCRCDECCQPFIPDGVLRTIGEKQNAAMAEAGGRMADTGHGDARSTATVGATDLHDQALSEPIGEATQSGRANTPFEAPTMDNDFGRLAAIWEQLPSPIRRATLALVESVVAGAGK
jgi:hypothetical protein